MTKAERLLGSTWLRRPGDRRAPGWRKLTNAERLQCNGRPGSVRSRLRMVIEAIGGMQLPLVGALVAAGLNMVAMNPRDFEGTWQASKDRSPRNTGLDQLRREARAQGSAPSTDCVSPDNEDDLAYARAVLRGSAWPSKTRRVCRSRVYCRTGWAPVWRKAWFSTPAASA